jgi:hypothetical protein
MHLMLLTFGDDPATHHQANFCILTFLREAHALKSVNVVTDSPERYRHLGSRANIHTIDHQVLEDWSGKDRFFWRVKIKAIEMIASVYGEEPVLYVDSDTYVTAGLSDLALQLTSESALMHENYGPLEGLRAKTTQRMWAQVRGRSFGGIVIRDGQRIWNAGVVGVPPKQNATTIRLALDICDDMTTAGVTPRLIEQFALSVALDHVHGVRSAIPWIEHYWGNKPEWNREIAIFFAEADLRDLSFDEKVENVGDFDFQRLPLRKLRRKTNESLSRLLDRLFPPRGVFYHREREA